MGLARQGCHPPRLKWQGGKRQASAGHGRQQCNNGSPRSLHYEHMTLLAGTLTAPSTTTGTRKKKSNSEHQVPRAARWAAAAAATSPRRRTQRPGSGEVGRRGWRWGGRVFKVLAGRACGRVDRYGYATPRRRGWEGEYSVCPLRTTGDAGAVSLWAHGGSGGPAHSKVVGLQMGMAQVHAGGCDVVVAGSSVHCTHATSTSRAWYVPACLLAPPPACPQAWAWARGRDPGATPSRSP